MRKRILSILSTLALMIYPLSVSAQSSFSLSLDVDSAAGDQSVTSLNTSADQVIAIQIFGTNIQNANALAVRFEYDATQVTYDGFDVGNVLPSAQALPEHGTNPTFVEIGIASLGGQATANSGLVGTIRFRATAAFSGTAIRLVRAELSRGGRFETITPNLRVELQTPPAPTNFSLSLDVDSAAGDQAVTSLDMPADQVVAIQIFGTDIQNANGVSVRFEYDASQVTYDGFDAGSVLPSAQALPEHGTNPTFVQIGIVSFGSQATVNRGLIGTIRFRTTGTFSGTAIRLARAELSRGGQFETITPNIQIALQVSTSTAPSPDFDGNGIVNIADFLAFVSQFGNRQGDGKYDAKYDLNSDGEIGIADFLSFVNDFGKEVSSSGGGGGSGGSGSPDLIVESPSVSDSTLTAGQSFTLQATVRNQGSGQATATTLRYYQSSDATITVNDTQVGTDTVGSLTASGTSAESISLNAPSRAGTYYYGACVEQVEGEPEIDNNCSGAVRVSVRGGTGVVAIPDANLRVAIEAALDKASGASITPAEMATLTRLEAQDMGIRDLTGLEFATGLTSLNLSNNDIQDISALSDLTNLRILNLSVNFVSDLSPLVNLTNLTSLNLSTNIIKNIAPLSGLNSLKELRLQENFFSDISPLSGLTNLTLLGLYDTTITDKSVLSRLANLTAINIPDANLRTVIEIALGKDPGSPITYFEMVFLEHLDAQNANISDLTGLEFATNLTSLNLGGKLYGYGSGGVDLRLDSNTISDISPLSSLTNLTSLNLSGNDISDFSPLSSLTNLTSLNLSGNDISDFSPLSSLTNLTDLTLINTTISNHLSSLSSLTGLTHLNLAGNTLSDLSPLSNLTNLTSLILFVNTISDVSALSNLTSLESLELEYNNISDISALSNLTSLESLWLSDNNISDISALSNLTSLEWLGLSRNAISNVSALSGMTNLTNLYITDNSISDIAPLVANMGLGSGDEVDVRNNPLSATSLNTHIPALLGRGAKVEGFLSPITDDPDPTPVNIPDANLRAVIERMMVKTSGATITRGEMATLTSLDAKNSEVRDLTGLEFATNLTWLDLAGWDVDHFISDLAPLAGLTNLTTLSLYNSAVSDVSALSGLTNLEWLSLSFNAVSDVSALAGMTKLESLQLASNGFSDVSALAGMTKLEWLYLGGNAVSDVSALAGLTNLEGLGLSRNAVSDVSALAGLTNLEWLSLGGNKLSDVSALAGLTNLEQLGLGNNAISDLAPLVANPGLGSGDEVYVKDNPLSATSLNTHIPTLQGRGVTVHFGSSKPAVAKKEPRMPSKPVVKENERRMPRASMEQFGVGAREEGEYMSRKWMEMKADVISPKARREIKSTTKTDERDRMRMEMGEDVISQKASLRDKARREIKSTQKTGDPAGTSED